MALPIYQVDAFTSELFRGNPAAVIPLDRWLDDAHMQANAAENNLSETAFIVAREGVYDLRWFTPMVEVDLCGHATLAAAHVLFEHLDYRGDEIRFTTRSGELRVSRSATGLTLDFPVRTLEPVDGAGGGERPTAVRVRVRVRCGAVGAGLCRPEKSERTRRHRHGPGG
jgi:PhzF family phenazine biosynthesis protein